MKFVPSLLLAVASFGCQAQFTSDVVPESYVSLIKAARAIENYQTSAVAMAKRLDGSSKGSDPEFRRFMQAVARADLSDVTACYGQLYQRAGLGDEQAREVADLFSSATGQKLLRASQQKLIADIEVGAASTPLSTYEFSHADLDEMKRWSTLDSYKNYGRITAQQDFARQQMRCVLSSKQIAAQGFK